MNFYISGNIERPSDMSRFQAEKIIKVDSFYEGTNRVKNFVCIMHLASRVIGEAPRDVDWIFEDVSLYQMVNGKYFVLKNHCAPFAGGTEILFVLEKDYFEKNSSKNFLHLLKKNKIDTSDIPEEEIEKLFIKREKTFYAERWLSYDYTILFGYFGYIDPDKDKILKQVETYKTKFEDSPDREILISHIEKEAEKALNEKDLSWSEKFLDIKDFDPEIAAYK